MKNITLIILIFILNVQYGFSIISYQQGDTLFNWAKSGLKIREDVGFKSEVIETIPFGESLVSMAWKGEYSRDYFEILDTYKVEEGKKQPVIFRGQWVKINFKGNIGYVFDAYLSKLSPPKKRYDLKDFLTDEIGIARKIQVLPENLYVGTEIITYNNGAYLKNHIGGSTRAFTLVIPGFSFEEAFQLIYHLYSPEYFYTIGKRELDSIYFELACVEYRIKIVSNIAIITGGFGC